MRLFLKRAAKVLLFLRNSSGFVQLFALSLVKRFTGGLVFFLHKDKIIIKKFVD